MNNLAQIRIDIFQYENIFLFPLSNVSFLVYFQQFLQLVNHGAIISAYRHLFRRFLFNSVTGHLLERTKIFSLIIPLDLLHFSPRRVPIGELLRFSILSSPLGAHTLINRTEVAVVISTATFNVVIYTYNLRKISRLPFVYKQ